MFFDVYIPTKTEEGLETNLQVQADDWRQAMEASARHRGGDWGGLDQAFIEVRENGERHITDQSTRTQYIIREIPEEDAKISQTLNAAEVNKAAEGGDEHPSKGDGEIKFRAQSGQHHTLSEDMVQERDDDENGRVLQETVRPSTSPKGEPQVNDAVSESALEEAFLESPAIFEPNVEMPDAIDFILDLAGKYIPSTHSGILFSTETAQGLYFAAARGVNSDKALELELPADEGLLAYSLRKGSSFCLEDATNDERYNPAFAESTGIEVQSILCAPVQRGPRTFGVLALINREGGQTFSQHDVNVAAYLGGQLGEYIQRQFDQQPLE